MRDVDVTIDNLEALGAVQRLASAYVEEAKRLSKDGKDVSARDALEFANAHTYLAISTALTLILRERMSQQGMLYAVAPKEN